MSKVIDSSVDAGTKEPYLVRFYVGAQCIHGNTVEADTMTNAIAMVLRSTVERYDDRLTHMSATSMLRLIPVICEVHYSDTYIVTINGCTYDTAYGQ